MGRRTSENKIAVRSGMYEAYIEFSRNVKNREELKQFETYCKTQPRMRRAFKEVRGRKFIFQFPDPHHVDEFLEETWKGFISLGLAVEKIYTDGTRIGTTKASGTA